MIHNLARSIFLLIFLFNCVLGAADSTAYTETIITPHWIGKASHSTGKINALFLVNDLARREPDELGQRFDLAIKKVRTLRGSNAYKNVFDLDQLAADLDANPDVFVISASKHWSDLGPKGIELVRDWVKKGGRLVVFTRSSPDREWKEYAGDAGAPKPVADLTEAVAAGIDLEPIFPGKFRSSFEVNTYSDGDGQITITRPFDRSYVRFNAFFPKITDWDDSEAARETGYLLANRIIRFASEKYTEIPGVTATVKEGRIYITGLEAPFSIQVRSPSGQLLAVADSSPIPVPALGPVHLVWEKKEQAGKRVAIGTIAVDMGEPPAFEVTELSGSRPRGKPIEIGWESPAAKPDWNVEAELYDADRNLLRFSTAPASAEKLEMPGWAGKEVTYLLRTVLRDSMGRLAAENLQRLHIEPDPEAELNQWTVLSWADERGDLADRWRGHRQRELGLNAVAPIGRNVTANQWASASGLRVIPTNVFVPKNRFNEKKFNEEQSKDWLVEFSSQIHSLSPLGYSFADEPPADVLLPWMKKGDTILQKTDPGARIGYCGVFPGAHSPELMKRAGYLGLYSPKHLYNLDIWLGVERDIYRSFRSPDSIVTIWTHYAPWADHEPYSRTVPWVWLFDEMDGVGYFKSTGMMFGILDGDMRTTHETRWWSEEIKELNLGVAEQVKRMNRDRGEIAILFGGNMKAVDPWARALNRLSIPYRFVDRESDLSRVKLLIAVDPVEIGKQLENYTQGGGFVIGGGGLATGQSEASAAAFESVFGFSPADLIADADSDFKGVRSSVTIGEVTLDGLTTGECLPGDGTGWHSLGDENAGIPESLKTLASVPAALQTKQNQSTYLALQPDTESVMRWMPALLKLAGVGEPDVRIHKKGTDEIEDRVYLSTFSDGVGELIGIVPDYMRISPVEQVKEIAPNPRDSDDSPQKKQRIYFNHGKNRWGEVAAKIVFGGKTHAYDVRRGEYLGEINEKDWSLRPGHPELIALLPYGPPKLRIESGDKVSAGGNFNFQVSLQANSDEIARHVIRVEIVDQDGIEIPHASGNIYLENGTAASSLQIPHGQSAGIYTVKIRDILTGASLDHSLIIDSPQEKPTHPFPPHEFRVETNPVDWPAGAWEPIPEESGSDDQQPAFSSVRKIQRKAIHYGNYSGKEHLIGGFKIGNGLREYEMKYLVCCDKSLFDPGPPQMVHGLNGSGLGMNKPHGHLWYYNSYLKLYLGEGDDREMALGYELVNIEDRGTDQNGAVRMEWMTPSAKVRLDYMMIPGHEGLFQKLTLFPREGKSFTQAEVNLFSYPAGFGKGGKPFFEEAQEHREWLLMGDAVRDRDFYETGKGSAGLLILPNEWNEIKYSSRPVLKASRSPEEANQPWDLHWVTWMFPKRGNAAAKAYMQTHSENTSQLLTEIFK